MLCLVFAFWYLNTVVECAFSYVTYVFYSRCGKVVILNVFKTGINAVSFLSVF